MYVPHSFFIVVIIIIISCSRIYFILLKWFLPLLFSWLMNIWRIKGNRNEKCKVIQEPSTQNLVLVFIIYLFFTCFTCHVEYALCHTLRWFLQFCKAVLLYECIANLIIIIGNTWMERLQICNFIWAVVKAG